MIQRLVRKGQGRIVAKSKTFTVVKVQTFVELRSNATDADIDCRNQKLDKPSLTILSRLEALQ